MTHSQSLSLCPALHGRDGQHHAGGGGDVRKEAAEIPQDTANQRYGGPKGFLLKMVERELSAAGFDSSQISGGGLKVTTTFDQDAQAAAVESAQKFTERSARGVGRKASRLHAAIARLM